MQFDWDDVRMFLEVERTGRFNHAAKRLGVSHTTVSRRIKQLEDKTGCHLFEPSDDGLSLTEAGRVMLGRAKEMENAASNVSDALGRLANRGLGRVRIGAPDGIGNSILSRILPELVRADPSTVIEFVPVPSAHKLWRRDVDIAISLDRPTAGRIVMRKLVDYDLRLYASPDYFATRKAPKTRADLGAYDFISYVDELIYTPELDFNAEIQPDLRVCYKAATVKAQHDAIASGIGLGVLPCFMARDSGLQPVLPHDIRFSRSYWLLYPEEFRSLSRIRAVSEFIAEKMSQHMDYFRYSDPI